MTAARSELLEQLRTLLEASDLLAMLAHDSSDEAAAEGFSRAAHFTLRAHNAVIDDIIYRIASSEITTRKNALPPQDTDGARLIEQAQAELAALSHTPYRQMIAEAGALLAEGKTAIMAYYRNRVRKLSEVIRSGRLAELYMVSAQLRQAESI